MSAIMQTNRWRQPGRSESGLPDTRRRKFELRSGVRPRREDQSVGARWDGLQVGGQHLGDKECPPARSMASRRIGG